jgi:hypothetical protein
MWWGILLSVASHHGEADPALLEWIKGALDRLIGPGPWVVVTLLGLLILMIPLGVIGFYLAQQRQVTKALAPGSSPLERGKTTSRSRSFPS